MVPQNARGRHDLPSRKDDKCQAEIVAVQTGARRGDCMIVNKHRSGFWTPIPRLRGSILGSDATSMTFCATRWRLAVGLAGGRSSPVHTSGVLPALAS